MFAYNPEAFIQRTSRLINEQKASQVIEHIRYNILEETFDTSVLRITQKAENCRTNGYWNRKRRV